GVFLGSGETDDFNPFPNISTYDPGTSYDAVAVGDVNNDGIPDIVALQDGQDSSGNVNVSVLPMNSDGSANSIDPHYLQGGFVTPGASIVLGDFNGDGIVDLIATSGPGGNIGGSQNNIIVGRGDANGNYGFNTAGYEVPNAA